MIRAAIVLIPGQEFSYTVCGDGIEPFTNSFVHLNFAKTMLELYNEHEVRSFELFGPIIYTEHYEKLLKSLQLSGISIILGGK